MPDSPLPSDPTQLPLGMFEGTPLVPIGQDPIDAEVAPRRYREPPVCGEWSYDDSELEESRFVAQRIDGVSPPTVKATPSTPNRAVAPANRRPTPDARRLAFEQTPGDTRRALDYIAALERANDAAGALVAIDTAREAGADPFALECARASALGALLRYDDAASAIKAAAKLRPDNPEVAVQRGILAVRRGRWRDAIEPLQAGIAGAPDHAQAHYHLAEALNHADRLGEAQTMYERAAALDPENWRALKGVGVILDRLGRSGEAATWYRRARDAQRG